MHQPSPWVIYAERKDEPSTTGQGSGLSSWRIIEVQVTVGRPLSWSCAKDVEVMTVEMNGVGYGDYGVVRLLDDPIDPLPSSQS